MTPQVPLGEGEDFAAYDRAQQTGETIMQALVEIVGKPDWF